MREESPVDLGITPGLASHLRNIRTSLSRQKCDSRGVRVVCNGIGGLFYIYMYVVDHVRTGGTGSTAALCIHMHPRYRKHLSASISESLPSSISGHVGESSLQGEVF